MVWLSFAIRHVLEGNSWKQSLYPSCGLVMLVSHVNLSLLTAIWSAMQLHVCLGGLLFNMPVWNDGSLRALFHGLSTFNAPKVPFGQPGIADVYNMWHGVYRGFMALIWLAGASPGHPPAALVGECPHQRRCNSVKILWEAEYLLRLP